MRILVPLIVFASSAYLIPNHSIGADREQSLGAKYVSTMNSLLGAEFEFQCGGVDYKFKRTFLRDVLPKYLQRRCMRTVGLHPLCTSGAFKGQRYSKTTKRNQSQERVAR